MTENKKFAEAIGKLENAKYGVEVRDAAADALRCCYEDIANVNSDEFYKALLKAADEGSISSLLDKPEPINSGDISEFANKLKKIENSVAELTRQLEDSRIKAMNEIPISKRLAEAESATKLVQEGLFSLKQNLEEHKKQITLLKEQTAQIGSLGDDIKATTKNVGSLKLSMVELNGNYNNSKDSVISRLDSLESKAKSLNPIQNSIEEVKNRLYALNTNSERHDRTIAKLSGAYGTLLEKQGNQAKSLSNLENRIAGIDTEHKSNHEITVASKKSISALEKDVDMIKFNIPIMNKNTTSIQSLEERLQLLESSSATALEYSQLSEDVQNLKAETEQFRNTVNSSLEHILTLIGDKIIGVG